MLAGLSTEMLRDDVLTAFLEEYEAETRRLQAATVVTRPEREVELVEVTSQLATIKTAILKGVDAAMFVDELKQLGERQKQLTADLEVTEAREDAPALLHADLGRIYRDQVARLTQAFEDEALKAQAFERIRALIEAVVLTPGDGELAIDLRGELASMLERGVCA